MSREPRTATSPSELFRLDDIVTADPAELLARVRTAREREGMNERVRASAARVARDATRFNAGLIRELLRLAPYPLLSNPDLTPHEAGFALGQAWLGNGELLRDAITILHRKGTVEISDALLLRLYDAASELETATGDRMGRHYPAQIRRLLDAISDARMAGADAENVRLAALAEYRVISAGTGDEKPTDRAGSYAASHVRVSAASLLRMYEEYPHQEIARAAFVRMTEGRTDLLRDIRVRTLVTKEFGTFQDVSRLFVANPHPDDFDTHYAALVKRKDAEWVMQETFADMTPDALAVLAEEQLARLLEAPSRRVRELAIAAIGPQWRSGSRAR